MAESQLALAHDALVRLVEPLFFIFKFALAFWQSSDNDVCPFGHLACNKQTLTNLEFVLRHTPPVLPKLTRARLQSPANDVSPVVATAAADTKKSKHYKPKVFARQRDNCGYRNALGYAQEIWVRPKRSLFPLIRRTGDPPLPAALARRRSASA